jgi:secreted PhoX family phosphatase
MQRITLWVALTALAIGPGCEGGTSRHAEDREMAWRGSNWAEANPQLFGVAAPLSRPADASDYRPRQQAEAGDRLLLAEGLKADFVSRDLASPADMMVLYPDAATPTHAIVCIEQPRNGITPGGNTGMNPGIQRVELRTGKVETILHGTDHCDGIRMTPWGTVLATEETLDGHAYELIEPLATTGHWIADRDSGDIRSALDGEEPSTHVVQLRHLPVMAWEGLAVLPSGVVYAGDELRPGDAGRDRDGGAIYKFLPATPRQDNALVSKLAESPLVAGSNYALTVSCRDAASDSFPQYGQGCEVGDAAWVQIDPAIARDDASARHATGYARPEDLHLDPTYTGDGVRFCWANTGEEKAGHFGEVMCAVDYAPVPLAPTIRFDKRSGLGYLADRKNYAPARVTRLVEGDPRFNSFDNLAFQPHTGNLFILEDHPHGEVIACLPDGDDRDIKSDGCIAIASVVDPKAEPTGLIFDASGESAYLILQHGEQATELLDFDSNPADGTTDDLIRIRGFEVKP